MRSFIPNKKNACKMKKERVVTMDFERFIYGNDIKKREKINRSGWIALCLKHRARGKNNAFNLLLFLLLINCEFIPKRTVLFTLAW